MLKLTNTYKKPIIIRKWEGVEAELKQAKTEQERTRIGKKMFLEMLPKHKGIISLVCEKMDIARVTYYDWRNSDPEFAKKVDASFVDLNDRVEDMLMIKIFKQGDGSSIRYFLDRKNPNYKPKVKVETQIIGDKTLEDLLDADNNTNEKQDHGQENTQGVDRGTNQDQKQEGGTSTVQVHESTGVLLEQEDEKKPDSQSEAKGDQ